MEKANTNINNQPVLDLNYKISEEEYVYYNELYAKDTFKKKKTKTTFVGILELLTGIGIILYVILSNIANKEFVVILCSVLIGLGIYSISFYNFIFPNSLKKAAKEQYYKNKYLQSEINMQFYNNRLEEHIGEMENVYKWNSIESFAKSEKLYFITIQNKRSILIPISGIGEDKYMLDEFFQTLSKKYDKPFKTW